MEILTFAAGLIVGTITVNADLRGVPSAELRLDGVTVCRLSPAVAACPVDLGPSLAVHRLELVRLDAEGRPAEQVTRWLNRPGSAEAEVRIKESCDETAWTCVLSLGWAHPDHARPSSWSVTLDGKPLASEPGKPLTVSLSRDRRAHAVAVEAGFSDGRRATATRVLRADRTDEAGDSLQAVPVELARKKDPVLPADLAARLGGVKVRTVEQGESEAVFVVDPAALAKLQDLRRAALVGSFPSVSRVRLTAALSHPSEMRLVHLETAGARFPTATAAASGSERLEAFLHGDPGFAAGRFRLADAVAAAGLLAGGSQRRRAVVAVLGEGRVDQSRFTAPEVRRYLAELMVPFHVFRVAPVRDDGWGEGALLRSEGELRQALERVNEALDRQRIAWVEGDFAPGTLSLKDESGRLHLAGRAAPPPA